jgi:Peptidase family M23
MPLVLLALLALAPPQSATSDHARVEIRPLAALRAVPGLDASTHVAYELMVINYHGDTGPLTLVRLEVFADGATAPLTTLDGRALATRVIHPGRARTDTDERDARVIAGGEHALVYLWLTLPAGAVMPRQLRHTLVFRAPTGREQQVADIAMAVDTRPALALGPPFRSGLWLAHEGPGNHRSHHWGSQLADDGRVTIPQRFAIDFIGLDASGRAVRGDARLPANDNWYGFAADVIAVADGIVRDARDGVVDNVPLAPLDPPASITARGLYGNYVVIEVEGRFVHYAHLQRGSLRVTTGQRVRRGDVVGRVGNSGNTTGPHLHLHVSDRATFEGSDGLPMRFAPVQVVGRSSVERAADLETPPDVLTTAGHWRAGLPLHGDVVRFDATRAPGRIDRAAHAR